MCNITRKIIECLLTFSTFLSRTFDLENKDVEKHVHPISLVSVIMPDTMTILSTRYALLVSFVKTVFCMAAILVYASYGVTRGLPTVIE